jgi:aryl-alcohol dehydrogenase-like predicted oxidoreductase
MVYRQLGRSGLRVSILALGTFAFGNDLAPNWGVVDLHGARRQVDIALDAGVNLIDTADAYSRGRSEEAVGQALAGRRDKVVLATKARMPMGDGPNDAGLSRRHLIAACEASLRRLRTDYIDLFQVHTWDGMTPLEETLDTLDSLVAAGKVRYVGCSNYAGWQLAKALGTSDRLGFQRFVSHQIYYSLEGRDAEYELVPLAVSEGVGIIVYSPLSGGLLSGKYRRSRPEPAEGRHVGGITDFPIHGRERLYDIVEVLVSIGEDRGVPAASVAVAYIIGRPGVTSVVFGARTESQLVSNLEAINLDLTADERARLDEVSALPLLYPYWHHLLTATDRLSAADLTLLGPRIAALHAPAEGPPSVPSLDTEGV